MTEEFKTLSKRIKQLEVELRENAKLTEGQIDSIIRMVKFMDKEFIRLLKEGIHIFNETESGDKARNEFIDKLAGKELVE